MPWLFLANLLFGFHFYVVQYVHSSFLSQYLGVSGMSIVFGVASLLALVVLGGASYFFARFGVYRVVIFFTVLLGLSSLLLATVKNGGVVLASFGLLTALVPAVLLGLDVFLDRATPSRDSVGVVRGAFLTLATISALFAPLLAGLVAGEALSYEKVYFVSALFLVPFFLTLLPFRSFRDGQYALFSWRDIQSAMRAHHNIRRIMTVQFLLRLYFAWMVVYLPVYLNAVLGFSWPDIGLILFFMLLPYVLVSVPAGVLADRSLGEKELLIAGFLITAVSTGLMLFFHTPSLVWWCVLLFCTRVGSALIEDMSEIYFFKKVHESQSDLVSFFRMLRPLAYSAGPFLGTLTLILLPFPALWGVLALFMVAGVVVVIPLKDTK
jgi:MFS family permease